MNIQELADFTPRQSESQRSSGRKGSRFFLSRNLRSRPEHKYGVMAVLIYRFAAIKIETICPFKVGRVEFDVGLNETSHLENVHRARKNSIQHKICKWFLSHLKAWKSEIIR